MIGYTDEYIYLKFPDMITIDEVDIYKLSIESLKINTPYLIFDMDEDRVILTTKPWVTFSIILFISEEEYLTHIRNSNIDYILNL